MRTITLIILTATLMLWNCSQQLQAQPEPPQRGDRYLPGELFHGKCYTSPQARFCHMYLRPMSNTCFKQLGGGGYIYPATYDTNSTEFRFRAIVPAFHVCPEVTSASIAFEAYNPPYPCATYIPTNNGAYLFLPMHPLDTTTMTYPISTSTTVELTKDSIFAWYKTFQAQEFQFQIATNKDFTPQTKTDQTLAGALVIDTVISSFRISIPLLKTLKKNTTYYWRVRPKKNNQWLDWSAYTEFTTTYTPPSSVVEQTNTIIKPTIAHNTLTINDIAPSLNKEMLTITIASLHGEKYILSSDDIQVTSEDIIISTEHLPIGWYAVQITDGIRTWSTAIIKR